jgi:hypothetical protein
MTGDHHGRVADTATLLLTATDEILGTHNRKIATAYAATPAMSPESCHYCASQAHDQALRHFAQA